MPGFTIGEFTAALTGIIGSLSGLADGLSHCDPDVEIDNTPGRTAICQGPIIAGSACAAPARERFTIADLVETIEGLRDWVGDVRSRLANYDPATSLEDGLRPPDESV